MRAYWYVNKHGELRGSRSPFDLPVGWFCGIEDESPRLPQGQVLILNTTSTFQGTRRSTSAGAEPPVGSLMSRKSTSLAVRQGARDTAETEAALRRIELTYDETLRALGAALDLRDAETAGHCERVTRYTRQIALQMKLPSGEIVQTTRGAYLHDIGKIGIPDSILLKPGKLETNEMEIMRTHVRIGYNLVSHIGFLAPAAQVILGHHEFYDGSGYPQRLKGKEIPQGSRIFSIADTLDAITSDRPYRPARSFTEARDEIKREAGRQFDPAAVDAFLSIAEETLQGTVLEERRRFARADLRTLVVCRIGGRMFFSSSCDISECGVSLSHVNLLEAGQELRLEFRLPADSRKIMTGAEVIRVEPTGRMAARFIGLSPSERRQIRLYIAGHGQL
jgi:HD domain/PilZ domain